MKLVVFGGSGGVGSRIVSQALEAGHEVVVYARSPHRVEPREHLTVVEGQLENAERITRTIAGADAVISALGSRSNTPEQVEIFGRAMETITSAMTAHGVTRLVSISGAIAVVTPDDELTLGRWFVGVLLRSLQRHVVAAKQREYDVIAATDLDWVVVRPTRIVPGPATGSYRALPGRAPGAKIAQGDVADFMLRCTTGDEWVRQSPIVGS